MLPWIQRFSLDRRNHRDLIVNLEIFVNDALGAYIEIHNVIFRDAYTHWSFLKNVFGRGVPMARLLAESERLLPLWDDVYDQTVTLRQSSYSSFSGEEQRLFDLLSRYVDAVRFTVMGLVDRQRLMDQGAKSASWVTWKNCKALQQKEMIYKKAIEHYMAIGGELNAASRMLGIA